MTLGHHLRGVMQHGQRLQAEQIDLEHADMLETDHVVLRDDGVGVGLRVRRRAHRHVVGERSGRDHDASRVHRGMSRESLDPGS